MAKQAKVSGKVQDQGNGKFKIEKGGEPDEVDLEIDMLGPGNYDVDKLAVNGANGLPKKMPDDTPIRWFNNFSIKHKGGGYVKQTYKVTIAGLTNKLSEKNSRLVIYSETHTPNLYYYEGTIDGDTFELNDGDPAAGGSP